MPDSNNDELREALELRLGRPGRLPPGASRARASRRPSSSLLQPVVCGNGLRLEPEPSYLGLSTSVARPAVRLPCITPDGVTFPGRTRFTPAPSSRKAPIPCEWVPQARRIPRSGPVSVLMEISRCASISADPARRPRPAIVTERDWRSCLPARRGRRLRGALSPVTGENIHFWACSCHRAQSKTRSTVTRRTHVLAGWLTGPMVRNRCRRMRRG